MGIFLILGNCDSNIRVNDNHSRDRLPGIPPIFPLEFRHRHGYTRRHETAVTVIALVALVQRNAFAAPLRLAYSVAGPTVASVRMAHESGMFKKYGLDVQLVYIASSGTNIQAILGGSLELSAPGMSGVVLAAARGAPEVQAAFEQKQLAGMVAVKPRAPARALLNAADLDIPFAMNVMAVTKISCARITIPSSAPSAPISKRWR